jgi:hypothetical protein
METPRKDHHPDIESPAPADKPIDEPTPGTLEKEVPKIAPDEDPVLPDPFEGDDDVREPREPDRVME